MSVAKFVRTSSLHNRPTLLVRQSTDLVCASQRRVDRTTGNSQTARMAEKDVPKRSKSKRDDRIDMRIKPATKEKWELAAEDMGGISLTAWIHIVCEAARKSQGIK